MSDDLQPDLQLQNRLSEYGLTWSPAAPDGNCFFKSVALNMTADYNKWSDTLARVGISKSVATNVETLSTEL